LASDKVESFGISFVSCSLIKFMEGFFRVGDATLWS
jgi:hypothetical protein